MITAATQLILSLAITLPITGNGSIIKYETYHNQNYDYSVEYPDFLIPQGEATNQDGQKFASKDQKTKMLVYRDYKNDFLTGGDLYTLDEAYKEDLKLNQGILNKKIADKYYIIEYKMNDILHTDYAQRYSNNYFNIRFEYPEKNKEIMKKTISHVIKSLNVNVSDSNATVQEGNASAGGLEDMFPAFLEGFLSDSYWGKNFNNMLRSRDKALAMYIDPKMDVRRYYSPGTVVKLASRAEDFGFVLEDDFVSRPTSESEKTFEFISTNINPCQLDFHKSNKVYYQWLKEVPDVLINMETFETKSIEIAYPNAEIMAVYLPNIFGNPRGFYFINTPDGWKIAFVDDSLCEA